MPRGPEMHFRFLRRMCTYQNPCDLIGPETFICNFHGAKILVYLGPLAGLLSLGFEARIPTAVLSKYQVEHVTHRSYMKPESLYQKQCRLHGFIRISNTVRTGSFTSRVITLAFPVAVESAFAFPVAISFLFCNFLHSRQ